MSTLEILDRPRLGEPRPPASAGHRPHVPDRRETTATALGHEELLTLARKVRAAAEDGDGPRFQEESERFLAELERHLGSEYHDLSGLPAPERSALRAGQDELWETASALAGADPDCLGVSRVSPARLVVALLQYQRELERRAAAAHGAR